ncbi:unnamed protein product [Adineta ricciae]|uniref:Uncharacterized protein n=1 Tax=Adineta ricciae TaxID=249248 RepID=A0A814XLF3_ADIRI|nr:unnamed protein product [Adineta ricciae]CAF1268767.1 unnamed protein product [Adineta ricciae]
MKLFAIFLAIGLVLLCLVSNSEQGPIRIPGRGAGGSGKPRQHFIHKNTRKEAEEAARRQGGGRPPIHHNERGQKSHYHPSDKNGDIRKDGSHFQYGKKKNG